MPFYKFYKPRFDKFILEGGWHFSSVKSPEEIFQKLDSYAEQKWNNEKFKNLETIKYKMQNKKDLFDRGYKYKVLRIDNSFPEFIIKNKNKLKNYIYDDNIS